MKFTAEQVAQLLPNDFTVQETDEGVRILLSSDLSYDNKADMLSPMPHILRAALAVGLQPEQLEDNSRYDDQRRCGSSWTGEYGSEYVHYDVTFLYAPRRGK